MNKITGSIPSNIAGLQNLVTLDLSYNTLTGSNRIDEFRELPNLEELILSHNEISGHVGQFGGSDSLRVVDFCK